MTMGNFITEES